MNVSDLRKRVYAGDNMISLTDIRYLPRWVILMLDILILVISFALSYVILDNLGVAPLQTIPQSWKCVLVVGVNVGFMFAFRTFAGIIRHSTFVDIFKLLLAGVCTLMVLVAVNVVSSLAYGTRLIRMPVLFIYFTVSFLSLFLFRLVVKEFFQIAGELRRSTRRKRILVLGITQQSIAIARAVLDNPHLPYQVVGFLTQRSDSRNAKLLGKPIISRRRLENTGKDRLGIQGVLLIREALDKEEMNSWVNLFLEKDLQIFKAPSVQKLRSGDMNAQIKNLQIEDLLNRKPIKIENDEVKRRHFEKNILVTGGAGSIGSEIVRQVAQFSPSLVVVLDQAETPLYEIELEVREKFPHINFRFAMVDVANYSRLEPLFDKYRFSMVYHAAAYKHVPLVEDNPQEAIFTNILGSKNLACLSSKYNVNRFVMVSTDKAVNPTNVMGATKRAAELFVQSLQNLEGNTTKFITTRFGNVLGSNGSVIPLFKRQIEAGGPLTITHPDIVRYFMTIPEACELVLQAGTMGAGGEVFVFDMGQPVKIVDLARRMIKLSGFEPGVDMRIVYTGLRPGEKLYEELLSDNTKTLPTHNEKIMISKDPTMSYAEIDELVTRIVEAASDPAKVEVVKILKKIVPEFKSNNSVYEMLDQGWDDVE